MHTPGLFAASKSIKMRFRPDQVEAMEARFHPQAKTLAAINRQALDEFFLNHPLAEVKRHTATPPAAVETAPREPAAAKHKARIKKAIASGPRRRRKGR
jgi:hypothetical protein